MSRVKKIYFNTVITLPDGRDVSIKSRILPEQQEVYGLPLEPARFEVLVAKWVLSGTRLDRKEEKEFLPLDALLRQALESDAKPG